MPKKPIGLASTLFLPYKILLFVLLITSLFVIPSVLKAQSQPIVVTGVIKDSTGKLMSNASVKVKNTKTGTVTDENGYYSIKVPNTNSILAFSSVGNQPIEEVVGQRTVINVVLLPSASDLDEVVIVAYGKQKKESVVGSITTINPAELKIPSSNLTQALAGRLAGVIAYQRTGEPGADNADFFIRGATTFGYKKDPLILIDGMEYTTTELARLNVDDIASFSIMKDATANALYGARGANGVILITTKEGKEGKAKIDIRFENSVSEPTKMVKLADPITYMKLENESHSTRNPDEGVPYDDATVANTISGVNPAFYPAVDWQKKMFTKSTTNQRFNLNLSGGGKIATYYIAGSINKDNGNLKVDHRNNFNTNIDLKTYTIRSNVSIKVTKSTTALVRLFGTFDAYTGPRTSGSAMYLNVMRTSPVRFQPYYEPDSLHRFTNHILFGNVDPADGSYYNPYANMVSGYQQYSNSLMGAQYEMQQDLSTIITPGLSLRGMVTTNRRANFSINRGYVPFYYNPTSYDKTTNTFILNDINDNSGTDYLDYQQGTKSVLTTFHGELAANYVRNFGKNGVTAMLIGTEQNDINGNETNLQKSLPSRNLTLGGRLTYSWDNKYFSEVNFAYNGSERFYKTHRFGFFPSIGAAWIISNEKFFQPLLPVISKLKIRGNYGLVGNDAIGSADDRFFYLSDVNMNNSAYGYSFGTDGGYSKPGISVNRYDNNEITWETAKNSTFGLEMSLFSKLDITAEYFTEERYNILMPRASIPNTMGLEGSTPKANVGKAHSNSIDISLNYNQNIGKDFSISGLGNFTFSRNYFKAYEEPQYDYPWSYRAGQPINQQMGYIAERLFVDDEEVRSSPTQFGKTMAGDIKYRDINGDGIIDFNDQVPIGFPTSPEIVYGFGFTAIYKNIDISAFAQGSARSSFWIDPKSTAPFIDYRYGSSDPIPTSPTVILSNQLLQAYADSHWSEDNRNLYALWPRLDHVVNQNNTQQSTWFMRNGSFLRIKQVQIGYTFPSKLIKKLKMTKFRIYFTGSNLFTISGFKLWDVEMGGDGLKYPIQKVYNIGINASF